MPMSILPQDKDRQELFIGFIALIIRCRIYTALKDKAGTMVKKPNYFTVPAAVRELEKSRCAGSWITYTGWIMR